MLHPDRFATNILLSLALASCQIIPREPKATDVLPGFLPTSTPGEMFPTALAAFETPVPEPTITPEVILIHPVPGASVVEDLQSLETVQTRTQRDALNEKIGIALQQEWKNVPVLTDAQVELLKKHIAATPQLPEDAYAKSVGTPYEPRLNIIGRTDYFDTVTVITGIIGETITPRLAYIDPLGKKHAIVELAGPNGPEFPDMVLATRGIFGNLDMQEFMFAQLNKTGDYLRISIIIEWKSPPLVMIGT